MTKKLYMSGSRRVLGEVSGNSETRPRGSFCRILTGEPRRRLDVSLEVEELKVTGFKGEEGRRPQNGAGK